MLRERLDTESEMQKKIQKKEVRRILDAATMDLNYTEMNSVPSWVSNPMSADVKRVFNFPGSPSKSHPLPLFPSTDAQIIGAGFGITSI